MARPRWGILSVLLLPVALLLATPTATADPYHIQVANDLFATEQVVYGQQWVAQSFVPTSGFLLSRIELYARDRGTSGSLSLEVRQDSGGFPGAGAIVGTTRNGPSSAGWLDFDLSSYVLLEQDRTYWIVASDWRTLSNGYEWWRSGSNAAYAPGTGALSTDGVNWTYDTEDYAFRVYGFQQPDLSFAVTASRATVDANESVVFSVNMTNAGLGSASSIAVNVSLPGGLTYVGDDAALIGGVQVGPLSYRFSDVSSGLWSFRLTVVAADTVPDGTVAEARFAFEGTDHNGVLMPRVVETIAITIRNPGSPPPTPWWVLGFAAIPIGLGLVLLVRRRLGRATVDEVFVVHRNGILLAHQSKTLTPDKDEDILAAMLKTVQDFVQEAFSEGEPVSMRGIQFGESNILIEPGRTQSLAVVYRGRDDGTLAVRARELSKLIEMRFGDILESWSGDMREVRGLRNLLPVLWGRRPEADADAVTPSGEARGAREDDATTVAGRGASENEDAMQTVPVTDEER